MTVLAKRSNARRNASRFRSMLVAIMSLMCVSALAQTPPGAASTDPPTRVGRLAYFSGEVSYSPAGDDQWVQAQVNRPIVTGDRLWADQDARVEVSLDVGSWFLGPLTSVTASNIDDGVTQFQLQQGTLDVILRRVSPGAIIEIDTPNIAFSLTHPGRYRVDVDAEGNATTVIARSGMGVAYGSDVSYNVMAGQAYRFHGSDAHDNELLATPAYDEFDRWAAAREGRFDNAEAARYVSPEVVGYADLDNYGRWSPVPQYGNVWFPTTVAAGWAPYRYGHWAWIAPWGWTWVDDAPWGFAPFHYGRWAYVNRGWGWIPGPINVAPYYAPALVAFVGGAGFGVAISSGPAIGWFPLGPHEIYRPSYSVTRNYFRQVNVSNTVIHNTTNITNIYNNYQQPGHANQARVNYANLHAPNGVTAVPPAAFARGQAVNRALVAVPPAALGSAQVERVARIAPQRSAFTGAAPVARAAPPAAVERRGVVARVAPPPPPVPISRQIPVLERTPGQPINHAEADVLRRQSPVTAPQVRMVAPKPVSNAARAPAESTARPTAERAAPPPAEPVARTPAERTARPPAAQGTPQPAERAARPPAEPVAHPPAGPVARPQAERTARPPAEQGTRPPAERAARPPAEPVARPPAERTAHPPAGPVARPPTDQSTRPPVERAAHPPAEPVARPPAERTAHPPAGPVARPPGEQGTRPPAEHAQQRPPQPPRGEARSAGEDKKPQEGKKEGEEKRKDENDRP